MQVSPQKGWTLPVPEAWLSSSPWVFLVHLTKTCFYHCGEEFLGSPPGQGELSFLDPPSPKARLTHMFPRATSPSRIRPMGSAWDVWQ